MSEIYHVLNRGVDKRKIFLDDKDYLRFIHDLFEFNDENPANNTFYYQRSQNSNTNDVRHRQIINTAKERKPRKLLVDILAFCLMPNHYHILIKPRREGALSLFMKKLDGGYVKYFNTKYERHGTLFERRYKWVMVKNEAHFNHLPFYIHLNPLDLISPEWRERKINNYKKATQFLNKYRWSSHLDYIGTKNFPSVTQREFLLNFFGREKGYIANMNEWLKDLKSPNDIDKFILLE